jgi:hypothetical protein
MRTLGYSIECCCGIITHSKTEREKHLKSICHKAFIRQLEKGVIASFQETKRLQSLVHF